MCDLLRGVVNENTQKALLYRKEGNIKLAKKFLTRAALEDDDDLAHFLILHAMQTGGFGIEKTDLKLTENQEELLLLKDRKFYPALLYFKYGEEVFFPYEYRELANVLLGNVQVENVEKFLERQSIYYIGCLFLAEFLLIRNCVQWMAEVANDAECQYQLYHYKAAAKQMHFKARKKVFDSELREGTLLKALKYCDDPQRCETFWISDDHRIYYLLGKKFYPKLYYFTQSYQFDPNVPKEYYELVWDNVHDATVTWLCIGKFGLHLPRDVNQLIGRYIWNSRLIEPEIWAIFKNPRKELENKSWWLWCKRTMKKFIKKERS